MAAEFAAPLSIWVARSLISARIFASEAPERYKEFYGHDHPAPELLEKSVYGLPEVYRAEIKAASLVASPGCYPTSILLPVLPLLKAGLVKSAGIIADALSGVTGAGRKVEADYLFAECNESARPYGIPRHRHLSEIEEQLSAAAGEPVVIQFSPHLIPINRGILATLYLTPESLSQASAGWRRCGDKSQAVIKAPMARNPLCACLQGNRCRTPKTSPGPTSSKSHGAWTRAPDD